MEILICIVVIFLVLAIMEPDSTPNSSEKKNLPPRIFSGDALVKCCVREEEYHVMRIESDGVWVIPWKIDGEIRRLPVPGTGEIYISNEDIEKHYIHRYGNT